MFSAQEQALFRRGYQRLAGIDEAGRGALAGPVVAAALMIETVHLNKIKQGFKGLVIKDSKQLSEKKRQEIFTKIKQAPFIQWQTAFVSERVIDQINIWQATQRAWQRCLKKLSRLPDFLFLDGRHFLPGCSIEQKAVIKGDQTIWLLSLASIVAKVSRDELMRKMDRKYPLYGFGQHKAYATAGHLEQLKKHGPCLIHRRSFKPVFEQLSFKEKVYQVVKGIPRGQVLTYQQVAEKVGQARAYRAVGQALSQTMNWPERIPCHRVIRSNGSLGQYNRGKRLKALLLKKEGVIIKQNGRRS